MGFRVRVLEWSVRVASAGTRTVSARKGLLNSLNARSPLLDTKSSLLCCRFGTQGLGFKI